MPVVELDLRAAMLRQTLARITSAPDDKSLNQVKDEAIMRQFDEIVEQTRYVVLHEELYAVGQSPEECVHAAGKALKWGKLENFSVLEGGDPEHTWGRRFTANGVAMKASGWQVPGGYVMTWWK